VANFSTLPGLFEVTVDLIDDGHADAISFHDPLRELHRVPIVGRGAINFSHDRDAHIHAKAWAGEECIYVFETLLIPAGSIYTVRFDA
jgi:hypothetical protein